MSIFLELEEDNEIESDVVVDAGTTQHFLSFLGSVKCHSNVRLQCRIICFVWMPL